ncbi:MAPEG family protein [uncultured Sphingomonas sp.]|uniref:MAPEG family protein n=1 Tax=uncultured Sphingomonas sp. TaxID=158754 RepID=UPI0025DF3204|nr:MAPEG family protein [uncultured Sphingomonas sp.]
MMMTRAILWPSFALVALIFLVSLTLVQARFGHMRRQRPRAADFVDSEASRAYFRPVERPAANLANLFEMPVLYFALVPLLLTTGLATLTQVALAWAYVALRAGHSIAHIAGRVRPRFLLFVVSHAVLAAMWIGLAIDIGFSAR